MSAKKHTARRGTELIGIDEAGRGPLAGPVVVAGVMVPFQWGARPRLFSGIRDSKKLTEKQRNAWFEKITSSANVRWAVVTVSAGVIDRMNIARAAHRGARAVYRRLAGGRAIPALLDGSLALPRDIPHRVIIKGDEIIPLISAASVIAKVTRDRIMQKLHRQHPVYGFSAHKGYGTKAHYAALRAYGRCDAHRKTFLTKMHEIGF